MAYDFLEYKIQMRKIIFTIIFVLITLLSYTQNKEPLTRPIPLAKGYVRPISCYDKGNDIIEAVESIEIHEPANKDGNQILFTIRFKGGSDCSFSCQLKNIRIENSVVYGDINSAILVTNMWGHGADKAYGTFSSDQNTRIETLDLYMYMYRTTDHYMFSWVTGEYTDGQLPAIGKQRTQGRTANAFLAFVLFHAAIYP